MAIFRAKAALGILQHVDLHAFTVIVASHFECRAHQLGNSSSVASNTALNSSLFGNNSLKRFVGQLLKIHSYLRSQTVFNMRGPALQISRRERGISPRVQESSQDEMEKIGIVPPNQRISGRKIMVIT